MENQLSKNAYRTINLDSINDPLDKLQRPQSAGLYEYHGDVYFTKWNKQHTFLFANRLVRGRGKDGKTRPKWVFEKGMMAYLREANRMTIARGAQLSGDFGCCIFCGHKLSARASIGRGIGPTCARWFAA
jgi:hypothetical protein